jgi:hypothetical protein
VFRAVRELTMTTWLMQPTNSAATAAEFRRRIDDLRSPTFLQRWSAFWAQAAPSNAPPFMAMLVWVTSM